MQIFANGKRRFDSFMEFYVINLKYQGVKFDHTNTLNNLAKIELCADFHARIIWRSVSPKFVELFTEKPFSSPSEGHEQGGY